MVCNCHWKVFALLGLGTHVTLLCLPINSDGTASQRSCVRLHVMPYMICDCHLKVFALLGLGIPVTLLCLPINKVFALHVTYTTSMWVL